MPHREWNNLPGNTQYTIAAMNGWTLTANSDGTVTLKHGGGHGATTSAATSAATSMTITPDPGTGNAVPPS